VKYTTCYAKVSTSNVAQLIHQPQPCTSDPEVRRLSSIQSNPTPSHLHLFQLSHSLIMSSLFGSGSAAPIQTSEEIKAAVMRQLQQEAAMSNARSLIGVRHHP
jgi:hypothetical protein